MTPLDTGQRITIFPKPIGLGLVASAVGMVILGLCGVWLSLVDRSVCFAILAALVTGLGLWLTGLFIRRRRLGQVRPTLMLSPEGLHMLTGPTGVIPWGSVTGLGHHGTRHIKGLLIHVEEDALAALAPTRTFKVSRRIDAGFGVHALALFENQSEVPLRALADMIHDYSIAHGGPPLQSDRHP